MRTRELIRFAVGGLWRQKVRTALTLVGVTVGTCALAFSVSLGLGLRAFIDKEFQGREEFWRIRVRAGEPSYDPVGIPPERIEVKGSMADDRRARIREALIRKYISEGGRRPPVMLTPDKVAAIAALPDVAEVRTYRTDGGRAWLGEKSATGFVAAGRLAALSPRLLAGRIPADDSDEVLLSEFTLYELGIRDDAELEAVAGRTIQLDVGGVRNAQPLALLRVLTGRAPTDNLSRGQVQALQKLAAALPGKLDAFDLTPQERGELKGLLERKAESNEVRKDSGRLASGEFRVAGAVRMITKEDRKRADPLGSWELRDADVFLPPVAGERLFAKLPWAQTEGFATAEVWVRPGGDLPGTVNAVEALGFDAISGLKWFDSAKREVTLIAAGLNLFAFIALFVAGIGITNTLVTSVVERTREIGILKAVGATRGQIQALFLTEGASIGMLGAALGLGLARLLVFPADGWVHGLIEKQMMGEKMLSQTIFVFPSWLWAASAGFAVLTTTAAAFYPARRAARIDPIQALKYE